MVLLKKFVDAKVGVEGIIRAVIVIKMEMRSNVLVSGNCIKQ